jgi:general secretion pathway protein D
LTGILTDPQFRVVLRMLEQREGVELLSAPDVTTVSGRQAQLQVVDIRTIVTGNDSSGGSQGTQNNFGTQTQAGTGPSINYNTQPLPFGPVLDVIPYVSADGFTVQMVIIPTITEFIGYDDPGQFIPQAQAVSSGAGGIGVPLTAQLPLPHFRVRQVTTTSIIWDGQTIVLGGLLSENVSKVKDKVPVLGDMPFVGRLFRSESNITEKKNLVIFVTPTIIDPAGNRVHMDDDLPFAQKTIPPQRPVVQTGAGAAK